MSEYRDSRGIVHSSEYSRDRSETEYARELKEHRERKEALLEKQVKLASAQAVLNVTKAKAEEEHRNKMAKLASEKNRILAKEAEESKSERNREREHRELLAEEERTHRQLMMDIAYFEKSSDLDKIIFLLPRLRSNLIDLVSNKFVKTYTTDRIGKEGEMLFPEQRLRLDNLNNEIADHYHRMEILNKDFDPVIHKPIKPTLPDASGTFSKIASQVKDQEEEIATISGPIGMLRWYLRNFWIAIILIGIIASMLEAHTSPGGIALNIFIVLFVSISGLFGYRSFYLRKRRLLLDSLRSALAVENKLINEKTESYNRALQEYEKEIQNYNNQIAKREQRIQADTFELRSTLERLDLSRSSFISEMQKGLRSELRGSVNYESIWSEILSESHTYLLKFPTLCRLGSAPAFEAKLVDQLGLDEIRTKVITKIEAEIRTFCGGLVLNISKY
jgi:hypothetical protein